LWGVGAEYTNLQQEPVRSRSRQRLELPSPVFHRYFLNQPTIHEHQLASRIAKTINPDKNDTVDNPTVETKRNKESKWLNNLIIHYTHEKRLAIYKKNIYQIWNQTFQETPVLDTRLIIGNRNSKNLTKQLVRRRP
jgi:hypothetical protein